MEAGNGCNESGTNADARNTDICRNCGCRRCRAGSCCHTCRQSRVAQSCSACRADTGSCSASTFHSQTGLAESIGNSVRCCRSRPVLRHDGDAGIPGLAVVSHVCAGRRDIADARLADDWTGICVWSAQRGGTRVGISCHRFPSCLLGLHLRLGRSVRPTYPSRIRYIMELAGRYDFVAFSLITAFSALLCFWCIRLLSLLLFS